MLAKSLPGRPTATLLRLCAAAGLVVAASALTAGPLTPPATVASTYKTLDEVEPRTIINLTNTPGDGDSLYKITQPGSYYLIGNVTAPSGKHGIEVAANNVTIDLMGFCIQGTSGCLDGIAVSATSNDITVRNGAVTGCRSGVILLPSPASFSSEGALVERLHVSNSTGTGTFNGYGIVAYANAVIRDCTVSYNVNTGIAAGFAAVVDSCAARANGGLGGITANDGSTITNCAADLNTGRGIASGHGSTILGCSASQNTGPGINTANSSSVADCSSYLNTGGGYSIGSTSTITNCSARQNGVGGIFQSSGSPFSGLSISNCTLLSNSGIGIDAPGGSSIRDCLIQGSGTDGIRVSNSCIVRGNTSDNNTAGAGIHATGTKNRIEANSCTSCLRGVDVDTGANVIVRNTCSTNTTNWDIAAGNVCLVVQGLTNAAAFTGNTGGVAPGSTDPSANFTH